MTVDRERQQISYLRRDIERRERDERAALLYDHNKKFSLEREALKAKCAALGHVRGRYHDNGLGWAWYYCGYCNARIDICQYGESTE